MIVIGHTPGFRVLVARLLTVRFVRNKWEQARLIARRVANMDVMGPLALIEEGVRARPFRSMACSVGGWGRASA